MNIVFKEWIAVTKIVIKTYCNGVISSDREVLFMYEK